MYKRIAIMFDESAEAERALNRALELASQLKSHLVVLTAMKPPQIYEAYAESVGPEVAHLLTQDHITINGALQAKAVFAAEAAGISSTEHFVAMADVDGIVALLISEKADLLILGLHRKTSTIARLWNKVFELAQDSPCSVLGIH